MPSNRRNRSTKSGADPQPGTDASAKITEITETIDKLRSDDDPDRVRKVLAKLRELFSERFDLSTLGDDLIKKILGEFTLDARGATKTLVTRLEQIIVSGVCISCYLFRLLRYHLIEKCCSSVFMKYFSLPEFEGKSLQELEGRKVSIVQLVMYHLEKRGYGVSSSQRKKHF